MTRMLRTMALALGASLAVSSVATGAADAKPDPGGPPCGFHKTATTAYYNHCWAGNLDQYIRVKIDSVGGGDSICIGPGDHYMGPASAITKVRHVKDDKSCLT